MNRLLLADIGGTYARFALTREGVIGPTWATEVRSRNNVVDAIRDFLAVDGDGSHIDGALLAVAGPVEGGRSRLTNADWTVDEEEICRAFKLPWVRVVNDLEAAAAGLPDLSQSQTRPVGPDCAALVGAPMAIIAPGTGLGVACLLDGPAGRRVIPSEGGHSTLAASDPSQERMIGFLRDRYKHVSAERVLSGAGLSNLHMALASIEGTGVIHQTPAQVTTAAFDGSSPLCRATVDAFCSFLGAVAGDIALTFGARGGVFIGGGIVPRFIDHLAHSTFRAQFENKGRMKPYLARIPTRVITHPNPAFLGLMSLVKSMRNRLPTRPAA
jgi:glucokinase